MPTYLDTIICEDIRQELGNKLTLAGVFGEEINSQQIPAMLASLAILQRWRVTNDEIDRGLGKFEFEMVWPDGMPNRFPEQALGPIVKGVNTTSLSFIFKFVGFPVRLAGEYTFRTYLDHREVYTYKFFIVGPTEWLASQSKLPMGHQVIPPR